MTGNRALCAKLLMVFVAAIAMSGDNSASAQQPAIQRTSLLQQDSPVPGYRAMMNIVEIPAGVSEVRHTHPGPLFGYVLEGTLTLECEGHPTAVYKAGDAFVIDAGKVHQGINAGSVPVKIVATLMVESGKAPTSPAP